MSDKDNNKEEDKLLYCSFCGKNQNEVRKLIAGPRFISVTSVLIFVMTSSKKK